MSIDIKTWQDRTGNHNVRPGSVKHMLAEITDLRAALEESEQSRRDLLDAANRAIGGGTFMGEPVFSATQAPSAPQEPAGDDWITAKVARHLDMQFRNGVTAGWNAGINEDNDALERLKNRVGTRAEYEAAFPVPSAPVARDLSAEFEAWAKNEGLIQESFGIRSEWSGCVVAKRAFDAGAALSVKAGSALDIEGIAKRVYDEADQGLSYDEYAQGKKAGIEALEHALLAAAPTPPTTGEA